jgi:hypothetical protein
MEFICCICEKKFISDTTDEEQIKKMKDNFGEEVTKEDCGVVCGPCYQEFVVPRL